MRRREGNKKYTIEETSNQENIENGLPTQIQDGVANVSHQLSEMGSLTKVLEVIRDFHRDAKQQLTENISKLTYVNQKIAEADTRIKKVEDCIQTVEQTLSKMVKY